MKITGYNPEDSTYVFNLIIIDINSNNGSLLCKGDKYSYIVKWSDIEEEWVIIGKFI